MKCIYDVTTSKFSISSQNDDLKTGFDFEPSQTLFCSINSGKVFKSVLPSLQVLVVAILGLVRLGGKDLSPVYLGSTDATLLAYGSSVSNNRQLIGIQIGFNIDILSVL